MINDRDARITGDIIAAFAASPRVHGTAVRVHTDRGWVRLEGVVDSLGEKTAAEEIARQIRGVKSVENDIVVSSDGAIMNSELECRVLKELESAGLTGIGARVEAQTAFLMGIVPSLAVKQKAVEAGGTVQGVRDVISELEIAAGEPLDDPSLANNVAQTLSEDPGLDILGLEVQAQDGMVLITGEVRSKRRVELAKAVAEGVPGVQYVENRLKVRRSVY